MERVGRLLTASRSAREVSGKREIDMTGGSTHVLVILRRVRVELANGLRGHGEGYKAGRTRSRKG